MIAKEILLVENDALFRRSIKLYFQDDRSFQFIEASSRAEALKRVDAYPNVRVILLDLYLGQSATPTKAQLDEETGEVRKFLDQLRERSQDYRVIVLTGYDEVLPHELARAHGVFNYLPKAMKSASQAIRFSVAQAFNDLERLELQRKNRFLLDAQKRINENAALTETLNFICDAVRSSVGGYTCHIRIYNFKRGDYGLQGFAGPAASIGRIFERPKGKGEFFSGRVVASGRAEFFSDLQRLPEFRVFADRALQDRPVRTPEEESEQDSYWRTVSSAYIIPIRTGLAGRAVDAVLNVSSQTTKYFEPLERRKIVDEFVEHAAMAIAKVWLDRRRKKIHNDYGQISAMLDDITDHLRGDQPERDIYDVVMRHVYRLIHPEVISVFRYNEPAKRIEKVDEFVPSDRMAERSNADQDFLEQLKIEAVGQTQKSGEVEYYAPGESLVGWVFEKGVPILLPDPEDPTSKKPMDDDRMGQEPPGSLPDIPSGSLEHYLAVPIRLGDRTQGVLRAMNKLSVDDTHVLERGFSRDCKHILEIAAKHLAVALRYGEMLRDDKRRLDLVQALGAVSRLINRTHTVDDLLELATAKMREVMRAQIGMLFLKRDQRVVLQRCAGMPLFDASYELGEDLTGRAALGEAEIITHLQKDDKYDDEIGRFLEDRDGRPGVVESGMVVPIFAKDTPIGVMKVVNKIGDEERYGPDDLDIFKTYADNMSVAIENATDYELTNKQLVIHERNAALSTLVTAVAHEIRNTSGLIPANVAGLRAQLGTFNDQVARRLNLIERVASQATDFANELAGFAASHRGEMVVRDVNEVVFAATTELQELPKFKNTDTVRLERRLSEAHLMCRIFENPFIQIVRNIVINAFQALEKSSDGLIVVTSAAVFNDGEEPMAVLRFEDNGPGIPSDYRERIFQADFTTKPNGTGVGLWLAKNQLGQIGGTISVESNEGGGARFVVTLPLAKEGGGQPDEATLASPAR